MTLRIERSDFLLFSFCFFCCFQSLSILLLFKWFSITIMQRALSIYVISMRMANSLSITLFRSVYVTEINSKDLFFVICVWIEILKFEYIIYTIFQLNFTVSIREHVVSGVKVANIISNDPSFKWIYFEQNVSIEKKSIRKMKSMCVSFAQMKIHWGRSEVFRKPYKMTKKRKNKKTNRIKWSTIVQIESTLLWIKRQLSYH